ncbi:MAG: D-Ala-D-Ala carboxypeptidase family metallohydrolase [Halanaerobiales bacterium]|nr:D-Ala-D-Ala carboxypeptidase family metallohydrolase [Halanaerobiales bacterium]
MINDIKISKDFLLSEFHSPDTHTVKLDPRLIKLNQVFRDRVGVPYTPNSAYRTPEHNKRVGGSPKSQHLAGKAIDIPLLKGYTIDEMANIAEEIGFDGIGKYETFIHLDVRGKRARWDYRGQK